MKLREVKQLASDHGVQLEIWAQGSDQSLHTPAPSSRKQPSMIQRLRLHVPKTQSVPTTAAQGQVYYNVHKYHRQGISRTSGFRQLLREGERER